MAVILGYIFCAVSAIVLLIWGVAMAYNCWILDRDRE